MIKNSELQPSGKPSATEALRNFTSSLGSFLSDKMTILLILGYGCFRAANSLSYSTAMLTEPETILMMPGFAFTLSSGVSVILFAALVARSAFMGKLPPFRLPIVSALALLACAQALSFMGVFSAMPQPWGTVLSAVLYAISTTCLNLAWLEMMVSRGLLEAIGVFCCGVLVRSLVESFSGLLSLTASLAIALVLMTLSTLMLWRLRRRSPQAPATQTLSWKTYKHGFSLMASALVVMTALEAMISFLNGFFLGFSLFSGAGLAFSFGSIGASLCFLVVAFAMPSFPDIRKAYRLLFPLLAATVAFLPFVGGGQSNALGALLLLGYNLLTLCAMYFIMAQTIMSRLNPYVVFACTTILLRLAQIAFSSTGYALGRHASQGQGDLYPLVAIAAVYGFAMLLMFFTRKRHDSATDVQTAVVAPSLEKEAAALPEKEAEDASEPSAEPPQDDFALRARELACMHHLTKRETEVLIQLARGRTTTFISEEFVCSPGTVRTHVKSIYAKLDLHSRQEVIDLFIASA